MEIKDFVDSFQKDWAEFKKTNEAILEQKAAGKSVGELETKLAKLNEAIDAHEQKNKQLEAAILRSNQERSTETKGDSKESLEYKAAWNKLLRKGEEKMNDLELKALTVNSDADGGFFVQADMSGRIIKRVFETSPIRSVANVTTISTDALEGMLDTDEVNSGMVSETGTRATTNTPKIGTWRIPTHEQYAAPLISQKMLDDAAIDIEGWLVGKIADKFARTQNTKFVRGTGTGEARGFMTQTMVLDSSVSDDSFLSGKKIGYIKTGVAADFAADPNAADAFITAYYSTKGAYRDTPGAAWAMHRSTFGRARRFKDTQGQYIWSPGIQLGAVSTILGAPVVEMNDLDLIGANTFPVIFANWREFYQIVDRIGMRIIRDQFTKKPMVEFYATNRFGGDVLNHEAAKFIKCEV